MRAILQSFLLAWQTTSNVRWVDQQSVFVIYDQDYSDVIGVCVFVENIDVINNLMLSLLLFLLLLILMLLVLLLLVLMLVFFSYQHLLR